MTKEQLNSLPLEFISAIEGSGGDISISMGPEIMNHAAESAIEQEKPVPDNICDAIDIIYDHVSGNEFAIIAFCQGKLHKVIFLD